MIPGMNTLLVSAKKLFRYEYKAGKYNRVEKVLQK